MIQPGLPRLSESSALARVLAGVRASVTDQDTQGDLSFWVSTKSVIHRGVSRPHYRMF